MARDAATRKEMLSFFVLLQWITSDSDPHKNELAQCLDMLCYITLSLISQARGSFILPFTHVSI